MPFRRTKKYLILQTRPDSKSLNKFTDERSSPIASSAPGRVDMLIDINLALAIAISAVTMSISAKARAERLFACFRPERIIVFNRLHRFIDGPKRIITRRAVRSGIVL
jgi:hypothetical protein